MDRRFAEAARRRAGGEDAGARSDASARRSEPGWIRGLLDRRAPLAVGALAALAIGIGVVHLPAGGDSPAQSTALNALLSSQHPAADIAPIEPVEQEIAFHDDSIIQDLEGLEIPQIDPDSLVVLAGCDPLGPQPIGPNGRLPTSALCSVNGIPLRADAAEALTRMDQAFAAEFGRPMCLGNGYRDFDQQAAMHRDRPHLVAPPGQSNHGLGLAVDFCGNNQVRGTAEYTWMLQNAPSFGWILPSWAQPGGSRPEPWHWEYGGVGRLGGS